MDNDAAALDDIEFDVIHTVVRCYTWNSRCITLGRLQDQGGVLDEFGDWPSYRRPTGGLAILHEDDLVVSVAAQLGCGRSEDLTVGMNLTKRGVLSDYFCVTEPIRRALADCFIITDYGQDAVKCSKGSDSRGIDCFKTSAKCDIVERGSGRKIVGSAMRRGHRAFLVQSSLRFPEAGPIRDRFLQQLQIHLARYLNVEQWVFPAR